MSARKRELPESARRLLDRPGLLGVVGTIRADGSPHAAPVWYRAADSTIRIWTDDERIWVRNLRRDDRVSFSVHLNEAPWTCVVLRGRAVMADRPQHEIVAEIERISTQYLCPAEIADYIAAWPATRTIVTIQPESVFVAEAFVDPVPRERRRRGGS
jgi:PPOX class probable F420-dependent enzyme